MNNPFDTAPTRVHAGDALAWLTRLDACQPIDGWQLHYRLLWSVPPAVDIEPTPEGESWRISLTSAQTLAWPAGTATLVAWATRGAERLNFGSQALVIAPDLSTATSLDTRSTNQRMLDDARAALADALAGGMLDVREYEIAGRRVLFRDLDQIEKLIASLERAVCRETAAATAAQGVSPGRVYTRM